jgi:hypothetical protein
VRGLPRSGGVEARLGARPDARPCHVAWGLCRRRGRPSGRIRLEVAAVPRCMALLSAGLRPRSAHGMGRGWAAVVARCRSAGSVGSGRTPGLRCMALRSVGLRPRSVRGMGRAGAAVVARSRSAGSVGSARMPGSRCLELRSGGLRRRSMRGMGRAGAAVVVRRHSAASVDAGCTLVSHCTALRWGGSRRLGRREGPGVRRCGALVHRTCRRGVPAGLTLSDLTLPALTLHSVASAVLAPDAWVRYRGRRLMRRERLAVACQVASRPFRQNGGVAVCRTRAGVLPATLGRRQVDWGLRRRRPAPSVMRIPGGRIVGRSCPVLSGRHVAAARARRGDFDGLCLGGTQRLADWLGAAGWPPRSSRAFLP